VLLPWQVAEALRGLQREGGLVPPLLSPQRNTGVLHLRHRRLPLMPLLRCLAVMGEHFHRLLVLRCLAMIRC
jgi:hypothetical protein